MLSISEQGEVVNLSQYDFADMLEAFEEESEYLPTYGLDEQLISRGSNSGLVFTPKSVVSDYETATKVAFVVKDFERISSELDLSRFKEKDYTVVSSLSQLRKFVSTAMQYKYIAVDTEASGLNIYNLSDENPTKDKIIGFSISWRLNQGIYVPLRHKKIKNLDIKEVFKIVRKLLEEKECIPHNSIYDWKVFYDNGIILNVKHDTMILLFHINSMVARGGKALKPNIRRIFDVDTPDLEDMTGTARYAGKFDMLDEDLCRIYGCADVDYVLQFFMYLLPYLPEISYEGYKADIDLVKYCALMEYEGHPVDMKLLKVLNEINNKDITKLREFLFSYIGTKLNIRNGQNKKGFYLFNPNSSDDLNTVLYGILGMEVLKTSEKTGKPVTNSSVFKAYLGAYTDEPDDALEIIMQDNLNSSVFDYEEFCKDGEVSGYGDPGDEILLKMKKLKELKYPVMAIIKALRLRVKLKTSFFEKLMNEHSEGKFFTSVSLAAAETHRIIDVLQTIPAFLKCLFVAYTEDDYEIGADYCQVEARVFSNQAGETELIKRLQDYWADFHRESGSFLFGTSPDRISDSQRKNMKVANFGMPFDMKEGGLVNFKYGAVLDKSKAKEYREEMRILSTRWKTTFWRVQKYLDEYREQALKVDTDKKVQEYFKGHKVSKIYSKCGRSRVFILDGIVDDSGNIIDREKASRITRQAGNFPIQDYARHMFGCSVVRLMKWAESNKLMFIKVRDANKPLGFKFVNLFHLMGLIHDEFLLSLNKQINPDALIEAIERLCMVQEENSCRYYMNISFGNNWHQIHGDKEIEMPVEYVMDRLNSIGRKNIKLARTELFDTTEYYKSDIKRFKYARSVKEIIDVASDESGEVINLAKLKSFPRYAIKEIINSYKFKVSEPLKDKILRTVKSVSNDKEDVEFMSNCIKLMLDAKGKIRVSESSEEFKKEVS